MIVEITDPAVLAQYPPGRLARCSDCGTYLRTGQPHSVGNHQRSRDRCEPHATVEMLTVTLPPDFEERAARAADERLEEVRRRRDFRSTRIAYRAAYPRRRPS